jgi:hypothetical protein
MKKIPPVKIQADYVSALASGIFVKNKEKMAHRDGQNVRRDSGMRCLNHEQGVLHECMYRRFAGMWASDVFSLDSSSGPSEH